MMTEMGSCEKGNVKSLMNDKWRHGKINRLMDFPSEETWPIHSLD